MVIEFAEILQDLELKRAAALPELPTVALPALEAPAVRVVDEDGGESRADRARCPRAWSPTRWRCSPRPAARRPTRSRRERSCARSPPTCSNGSQGAATVTVHDVTTLVEAALIAAGYFDVAKALVLRRALPTHVDAARRCG